MSAQNSSTANATSHVDRTNPEFTQHCINAIGPNASPRARELGAALFRHIHAFAREVQLTTVSLPLPTPCTS